MTIKTLLWTILGLVLALGVASVRIYTLGAARDAAAARAEAADQRAKSIGENRDQWKQAAEDRKAANAEWRNVAARRLTLLQEAQAENTRMQADNATAAANARVEAERLRREAAEWQRRAAPILSSNACQSAKAALERACPIGDY